MSYEMFSLRVKLTYMDVDIENVECKKLYDFPRHQAWNKKFWMSANKRRCVTSDLSPHTYVNERTGISSNKKKSACKHDIKPFRVSIGKRMNFTFFSKLLCGFFGARSVGFCIDREIFKELECLWIACLSFRCVYY